MTRNNRVIVLLTLAAAAATLFASQAMADPIKGRDILKFSQKPMVETPITDSAGNQARYFGHDELSTAYGFGSAGQIDIFQGRFMADDFADRFDSPVVHVKWWGSYLEDFINPNMPVDRFLISFESDVRADQNPNGFSHPGEPLLNQIVRRDGDGVLTPGEGSFTESRIRGPDPVVGESLYEYNAELHLKKEFFQQPDTVYWLKIVALVDLGDLTDPKFDPYNPDGRVTRWGWHNRDYTVPNLQASRPPAVTPGEGVVGSIGDARVWHFQDDAVSGSVIVNPNVPTGPIMPEVLQRDFRPETYLERADGPFGISEFSKDLAFELFTIPEPTCMMLMMLGGLALVTCRRGR